MSMLCAGCGAMGSILCAECDRRIMEAPHCWSKNRKREEKMLHIRCRNCGGAIPLNTIKVELSAEEDGVELSYHCTGCHREFFAVVEEHEFEEVD